jgi:hypothetical protein
MYSRDEQYCRRGTEAQQRAAQTTDLAVKEAFKELARGWFVLAEQVTWQDPGARQQPQDQAGIGRLTTSPLLAPKGASLPLRMAPLAGNPFANTVSESEPESEPNDQNDCELEH